MEELRRHVWALVVERRDHIAGLYQLRRSGVSLEEGQTLRPDMISIDGHPNLRPAARHGAYSAYQALTSCGVVAPDSEWRREEPFFNIRGAGDGSIAGESIGLACFVSNAIACLDELCRSRGIEPPELELAATGVLKTIDGQQPVGRVDEIVAKLTLAMAELPAGSAIFYPAANRDDLIAAGVASHTDGHELVPVRNTDEVLQSLFQRYGIVGERKRRCGRRQLVAAFVAIATIGIGAAILWRPTPPVLEVVLERQRQTGGEGVSVVRTDGTLKSGDRYRIAVTTEARRRIYILQIDSKSEVFWLWPPHCRPAPLDGSQLRFPEPPLWLPLDQNIGSERVLVASSREPIQRLEEMCMEAESVESTSENVRVRVLSRLPNYMTQLMDVWTGADGTILRAELRFLHAPK